MDKSIQEQLDAIRLEAAQLELVEQRERVAKIRAKHEAARIAAEQQEQAIKATEQRRAREQRACPHRKGGMDLSGILNGNESNYSVVKHTLPLGKVIVMCTRCQKLWEPGHPEYNQAINFPTDNQPSTSSLFVAAK